MRIISLLVVVLVGSIALLRAATPLLASDSITVNFGASQHITAYSICKNVTNNSPTGKGLYVPTQSVAEWQSFYMNLPAGVTVGACTGTWNSIQATSICEQRSYCGGPPTPPANPCNPIGARYNFTAPCPGTMGGLCAYRAICEPN